MSMTDGQLNAIEARAEAYDPNDYPQPIMAYDIPALVAEVRRLRGQVGALVDVIYDANGIAYPFEEMQDKMTAILNGAESGGA